MELTALPLPAEIWAATPAAAQALDLGQQERIRELEARLGQNSSNSSRPPSDPPQVPARPKASPSGRKRGGQPGHRGAFRALLPVGQVDEVVAVEPERCRHCEQPFPWAPANCRGRVWRHEVVELLPLAVRVTEYQMTVRRCPACGQRTGADLPGRGAAAAVRCAPDRRHRATEWPLPVEPPGSAAGAPRPLGRPAVVGRGGAPGAGAECCSGPRCGGSPGRHTGDGRGQPGRNGLARRPPAGLAVDGGDRRADRVSD
jgi:hypothetical protein